MQRKREEKWITQWDLQLLSSPPALYLQDWKSWIRWSSCCSPHTCSSEDSSALSWTTPFQVRQHPAGHTKSSLQVIDHGQVTILSVAGTDKERGIKSWQDRVQAGSKNMCDQSCYDIPFCNSIFQRYRCFQYVPFLPSYKTTQKSDIAGMKC